MADLRPILVLDSTGAPLTGAAGSMSAQAWSSAGVARGSRSVLEVRPGHYAPVTLDEDEAAGTVVLLDCGAGRLPRRVAFEVFLPDNSNQFWAVVVEDPAGALWTGAAPTVGEYGSAAGARTPPATVAIPAGSTSLFTWTPTAEDVAADVAIRIVGPAGSSQPFWSDETREVTAPPALPTSSLHAALFAALTGSAPVAALVAARVWPDIAPQDAAVPLLVVTVVDDVAEQSLSGAIAGALSNARVQVDAYAKTRVAAGELAAAVLGALGNLKTAKAGGLDVWAVGPGRNLYDDEAQLYRVLLEFHAWR